MLESAEYYIDRTDMNQDALSAIVSRLDLQAGLFTEADYCRGAWAIDDQVCVGDLDDDHGRLPEVGIA